MSIVASPKTRRRSLGSRFDLKLGSVEQPGVLSQKPPDLPLLERFKKVDPSAFSDGGQKWCFLQARV